MGRVLALIGNLRSVFAHLFYIPVPDRLPIG